MIISIPTISVILVTMVVTNCIGLESNIDASQSVNSYDTKYDDINLDEIIGNERLLKNYVNCLLNEGPCTPDGQELKDTLPDAISNDCAKCSDKQKIGSTKVMHHMIDNMPDDWEKLEVIYDPSGIYRKNYLATKNAGGNNAA